MTHFREIEFKDQTILLDHNSFTRCRFERCTIVFGGGAPGAILECELDDSPIIFEGPAKTTIDVLSALLQMPGIQNGVARLLGLAPVGESTNTTARPGPAEVKDG